MDARSSRDSRPADDLRRPVYHLNYPAASELRSNSNQSGSNDPIRHGTRITILDNGEIYVPKLMPQPSSNDPNGRGMVFRKNRTEFLTVLGLQASSHSQIDRLTEEAASCSDTTGQQLCYETPRPPSQPSTPRPTLVRRNASPGEEVPSMSYFAGRNVSPRAEVPAMSYFAQIAPGTIPVPTTGFTSPEVMPANPPQQPVIRPQPSSPSNVNGDGLFLLGAAPGDFFIPPGRFKLPPPQSLIAPPMRGCPSEASLKTKEPQYRSSEDMVKQRSEEELEAESKRKKDAFAMLAKAFKEGLAVRTSDAHPQPSNDQEDDNKGQSKPQVILPPGVTDQHEPWIIERKRLHMEKLNDAHIQAQQKEREEKGSKEDAQAKLTNADSRQKMEKVVKKSNAELIRRLRAVDRKHAGCKVEAMLARRIEFGVQASRFHEKGCNCNLCANIQAYDWEIAKTVEEMSSMKKPLSQAADDEYTIGIRDDREESFYLPLRLRLYLGGPNALTEHILVAGPQEKEKKPAPRAKPYAPPSRSKDAETQTDKRSDYYYNCVCWNCMRLKAQAYNKDRKFWRMDLLSEQIEEEETGSTRANWNGVEVAFQKTKKSHKDFLLRQQTAKTCHQLPVLDYDNEVSPSELGNRASESATVKTCQEKKGQSASHQNTVTNCPTLYTSSPPYGYKTVLHNEREPPKKSPCSSEGLQRHQLQCTKGLKAPMFHFKGSPSTETSYPPSNPTPAKPKVQPACSYQRSSMQRRPTKHVTLKDIRTNQQRQHVAKLVQHRTEMKAAQEKERQDMHEVKLTKTLVERSMAGNPAEHAELEVIFKELEGNDLDICYCLGRCKCNAPYLTWKDDRVKAWVTALDRDQKWLEQPKGYYQSEEDCICGQLGLAVDCHEAVAEDSGAICKGGTTQTRGYCSPSVREKEEASSKDWHMNWADNLSILDDPGYQAECDGEDEENVDAEAGKTEDEEKEWQKVKERPRHEEVPEWDCMVFDRERNILVTKELVYGSRSDEMDNNPFGDIPGLSVDESDALPRRKKKGGNKSEYKEGKLAEMVFDCERNLWVKRKSLDGSRSNETDEDRFAANPNLSVAETDEGFEIVYRY